MVGRQTLNLLIEVQILVPEHYDTFYALKKPNQEMMVDKRECSEFGWFTIPEVLEKITHDHYVRSVEKFVKYIGW